MNASAYQIRVLRAELVFLSLFGNSKCNGKLKFFGLSFNLICHACILFYSQQVSQRTLLTISIQMHPLQAYCIF